MQRMRQLGAVAVLSAGLLTAALPQAAQADKKPTHFDFTMTGDQVVPGPGDPDRFANAGCAIVDKKVLMDIREHPHQYYLDAHNTDFADGAIRGQLA